MKSSLPLQLPRSLFSSSPRLKVKPFFSGFSGVLEWTEERTEAVCADEIETEEFPMEPDNERCMFLGGKTGVDLGLEVIKATVGTC